jgi:hypothetical protein
MTLSLSRLNAINLLVQKILSSHLLAVRSQKFQLFRMGANQSWLAQKALSLICSLTL